VAVLGGGIIGASTAAHLVERGSEVVLVTEGELGSGASGRSLSWLNSFAPRSAEYHRLRLAGLDRYRAFLTDRDAGDYLRFDGGLAWADPEETDSYREIFATMVEVGYSAEWLVPAEVDRRVPGVNTGAIPSSGAIFNPAEGLGGPSFHDRRLGE
jgi:glycine/D-amino acid oxidase-like deaminating enzyme